MKTTEIRTIKATVATIAALVFALCLTAGAGEKQKHDTNQAYDHQRMGNPASQNVNLDPEAQHMRTRSMQRSPQRASKLLGMDVLGTQNEKVGEIESIVLSDDLKTIDYMVISVNDDMQPERLALPPSKLSLASHRSNAVSLRTSLQSLRNSYGIEGDRLPRTAGSKWQSLSEQELETRSLDQVLGMDVNGRDGKNIGYIEDLVINLEDGQIEKATVSTGGFLGFGAKMASVDWNSVDLQSRQDRASVNTTKKDFMAESTDAGEYWQRFAYEGEEGYRKEKQKNQCGHDADY